MSEYLDYESKTDMDRIKRIIENERSRAEGKAKKSADQLLQNISYYRNNSFDTIAKSTEESFIPLSFEEYCEYDYGDTNLEDLFTYSRYNVSGYLDMLFGYYWTVELGNTEPESLIVFSDQSKNRKII